MFSKTSLMKSLGLLGRGRRARGEVIDPHLALYVRLPGQQLGEDGELVVDLLEHHLDEDAEGHLGQSEMSIRSHDHVWTNERSLLTM